MRNETLIDIKLFESLFKVLKIKDSCSEHATATINIEAFYVEEAIKVK